MTFPLRIVFLDFDGVLNSEHWDRTRPWSKVDLDPQAVQRLNQLNYLDVRYVISSSWRKDAAFLGQHEPIEALLRAFGFTGHVVGRTPDLASRITATQRGQEILAWLEEQPAVESFVIFDDDDDMGPVADRLVQTDWRYGLQDEHLTAARELLLKPWPR